ncbi:ABC transporter substrate-binding protein [Kineococcus arenarius]|uniref:ABC transporter substrate-binding protein n=1 Tax=unclassified Kineococcus TaxID=2621656 RepID=UPI003D7E401D
MRGAAPVPRRAALAAGAGALALTGCGRFGGSGAAAGGDEVELTVMAWASASQAQMYESAFATYHERNPGVRVRLEWMDVASYPDKLNTKFAAGSPPDVMFLVGRWLGEYASRGALAKLGEHAETLHLDALADSTLDAARLDGEVYAVPTGTTAPAMVYNQRILDEAGLALPDDRTWTWDEFRDFNAAITAATGGKVYGTGYNIPWAPTVAMWAGQHGEALYTADGDLGMSAGTLADYFQMTLDLRAAGGYPPPGFLDDQGQTVEDSALGKGAIASQSIPANVFADYDDALGGVLTLARFPGEVPTAGYQVTPTLLWAQAADSQHSQEAAALIDYLTNDPESFTARSALLGVPVNPQVAATVSASLPPDGQTFVDFLLDLQDGELQPYHLEPAGAGEIADNLVSIGTEVEFGRMSPQQAGERFVTDARASLERAAS